MKRRIEILIGANTEVALLVNVEKMLLIGCRGNHDMKVGHRSS
jgi:hypothetical protein